MEIKVYNNVFENEYKTFEYDTSKPLLEQVEQQINKETYREMMVECYDSETGQTFYAPMIDDAIDEPSVMIIADGKSVDKDYMPNEGDLVSVVFLPANERAGKIAAGVILGAAVGILIGGLVIAGSVAAAAAAAAGTGMIVGGSPTLLIILGIVGGVAGGFIGNKIYEKSQSQAAKNSIDSGKDGSQLPDVRGAENTSIRGNNFPFVIGKHLITPFVIGDPFTIYEDRQISISEYENGYVNSSNVDYGTNTTENHSENSGDVHNGSIPNEATWIDNRDGRYLVEKENAWHIDHGIEWSETANPNQVENNPTESSSETVQDNPTEVLSVTTDYTKGTEAYVNILLCAGYAPLKLTDFKLGEFWLAYNRSHKIGSGEIINKDTLLSGKLKGYSYGGKPDNGDILDYWKNNDISIEILQQPSQTGEAITIDEIYQEHTTIDLANRPQIPASAMHAAGWTEVPEGTTCTVYSQSYSTEDARYTVLVTPILSNGTVLTPSQTQAYAEQLLANETISVDILLATFSGSDSIEQSNEYAQGLHENQEAYYNHEHYPTGINYGTIYPYAINDQPINANVLYIADKKLDENAQVVYKGASFPNKFKTNGVWFTDSCPMEFTVTIDFPNGLYRTYSKTTTKNNNSNTETVYNDIPLWVCAQWRVYNENNASPDPNGTDYSSWNNIDFGYSATFTYNDLLPRTSKAGQDVDAHNGNDFDVNMLNPLSYRKVCKALYGEFLGKTLQNFQPISGEKGQSEMRLSATIQLTNEQIAQLMAETNPGHIIEVRVIRVSPNYINDTKDSDSSENTVNYGPESYSDLIKVSSILTKSFDEETYIKTGNISPIRPLKDEDYRKYCLIAVRAKADASGYLTNQLSQINCMAESFSPIWDYDNNKLLPEDVFGVKKYFGYFDQNNNPVNRSVADGITEREVTRAEYEQARQDGFNWVCEDQGTNYSAVMRRIVFTSPVTHNGMAGYKLTQEAARYNNNSVVSGFMLACVGPQNGPVSTGYDGINLLSIGDWALKTIALRDGTKANRTITYRGQTYHDGDELPLYMEANGYVYSGIKLEDLLQKIALCGRAYWCADENGKIKVIMDGPVDYTSGVINAQNCISSSNTFSYGELPAGYMISFSDENDGYETNQFYVWADGNNEKSYHGQVEALGIDFVTNNYQMYSLARYLLALRVQTREVLTRRIGLEGKLFDLGAVVLVQSEDLLIGDCSGRIQEVLEDATKIYGFVTDAPYEYNGEQSDDDCSTQGVTVLQPGYMGKSNSVTLPIAMPKTITVDEKIYKLEVGTTNLVLFDEPIDKGDDDTSASNKIKYKFKTGDICMFGLRDKISAPYKITKIKPDKDGTFTETLVPYNEDVYRYGEKLPSFQNYITPPVVTEPPITMTEGPSSVAEQLQSMNSVANQVNNVVNGQYVVEPPDVVTGITAIAEEEGIRIVWNPLLASGMRNVIHHYTVQISKDNKATWSFSEDVKDSQYFYKFVRTGQNADGYPEATDLSRWWVRISSVNIYGRPEGTQEDPPNYSEPSQVIASPVYYGTWIIPGVSVVKEVVDRTVVLTAVYAAVPENRKLYGNIKTNVKIKLIGNTDTISTQDIRTYNQMLCVYSDQDFAKPEFDKRVTRIETASDYVTYGNTEENYKQDSTDAYQSLSNKITHTLPLIGQNPRFFKAGNIPVIKRKADPTDRDEPVYQWEAINKASETEIDAFEPKESDVIHYTGRNDIKDGDDIRFYSNGYYVAHGVEVTPTGSENPSEEKWYEYDDENETYSLSEDTTVVSGKTYYTVWEQVLSKSMAVPTEYQYVISMSNEAGTSNEVTISEIALPTNISDIVHSHEHYKNLYVEKLSAINANIGLISQGGFGSFAEWLNFWALSDLSAEESGVPGGVKKGAFRVGGRDQYFQVTPRESDPTQFDVELRAGSISLSTDVSRDGFVTGTYIYEVAPEQSLRRLHLTSTGIVVESRTSLADTTWNTKVKEAEITIDSNNNMIITNSDTVPDFGFQANGDIYHFDNTATSDQAESGTNPQGIVTTGGVAVNNGEQTESYDTTNPLLSTQSSPKSLFGDVTKTISSFTGNMVFFSKSEKIILGNDHTIATDGTVEAETIPAPLSGYNQAMKEQSTVSGFSGTVGAYLGLNETQVQKGIFY